MSHCACYLVMFAIFGLTASTPPGSIRFGNVRADRSCMEEAGIDYFELGQHPDLRMGQIYHKKIAHYNLCIARKREMVNHDGTLKIKRIILPNTDHEIEMALYKLWRECRFGKTPGDPCKTFYDETDCFVDKVLRTNSELIFHTAYAKKPNLPHNLPDSDIQFYVNYKRALS